MMDHKGQLTNMFNHFDTDYLKIASKKLDSLSFCEASVRQLNNWVKNLPMVNIGETSRLLYHAIIEINQLNIQYQLRFELLELVRQPIYYVCSSLSKKYLENSLVLDESQRKVANLSQALQDHLATGYKSVVREHMQQPQNSKHQDYAYRALHRCMSDLVPSILRSYQLYLPTPALLWKEIHQLFQLAKALKLEEFCCADNLSVHKKELTIRQCYVRAILLSTCQPNQLQKSDLLKVYHSLELWINEVEYHDIVEDKDIILVDPDTDGAPIYRYLAKTTNLAQYHGLNTLSLIRKMHEYLNALSNGQTLPVVDMPKELDPSLLQHLIQSWGGMKQRAFSRFNADGEVEVCIGLTAMHFHLAGGQSLQQQLNRSDNQTERVNQFLKDHNDGLPSDDIWEKSYDAGKNLLASNPESSPASNPITQQPKYKNILVNTSPRGYCLQWPSKPANNLETGEIIAIKESNLSHWNVGILRWIRLGKEGNTQMGVELISPNSHPCAARILCKTGEHGDYLRALYIPEIQAINQAATLLTAKLPFQASQKIGIYLSEQENKYQLVKKILSTSKVNQFQIRAINKKTTTKPNSEEDSDPSFDNLWQKL